jgi:hypothetical protein
MASVCRSACISDRRKLLLGAFAGLLLAGGQIASSIAASAEEEVDLLLVLAADISRSVDAIKFKLQREGYAAALTNPKVISAIESVESRRIAVCFVEWSGSGAQTIVVDWTPIGTATEARAFADRILAAPRLFMERTSISAAIDFSLGLFERSPFVGKRRVIDVSGDGTNNHGRDVLLARDEALAAGVTINGLAILSDTPLPNNPLHTHPPGGLLKYYEDNVIGGPGAFAIAAENHEAFGRSILNKLIKEIALAPSLDYFD